MNHAHWFFAVIFLVALFSGCSDPIRDEAGVNYEDMDVSGMRIGGHLLIKNNNNWTWRHVELVLNAEYRYTASSIAGGSMVTIPLDAFTDGKGHHFNYLSQACTSIKIRCETPAGEERYWP